MGNTNEVQAKEMEGKKYKWNKGLLTVYALILLPFVVLWIVGWIYIGESLVQIFYSLSSGLICLGLIYVFTASIYQKYVYALKLGSKYNKQKNELDTGTSETKDDKPWGDKAFGFILKFRVFPSQQFWFFVLLVLGVIVSLIPYQNWYGAESVLDIIIIFRKTMQMFVVDGGVDDFINNCSMPYFLQGVGLEGLLIYNIYFAFLSVATGLIFTFKLIFIFAKEFKAYIDYWWGHLHSDIYVMSELNEQSITLAESIFVKYLHPGLIVNINGKEKRSDLAYYFRIYFCDVYSDNKEKSAELILRAKRIGATVMKRDITEIKIKRLCKSNRFYLIGSSEEENVEQAQQICTSGDALNTKKNLKIYIYATRPESENIIDNMHNKEEDKKENEKVKVE